MTDTLFDLAHRDDPRTSKDAIRTFDRSGARASHMQIVEAAVHAHPFSTAPMLCLKTGLGEYQVRRRLTDLKNRGKVARAVVMKCPVKGTDMVTWIPTERESAT